ncbi:proline--tRNA ligase [Candidatus Woesearchaeota archaeon]|nr:proline--tRNA ligase [Candidatus Woesearchaeota archaeon]
MPDEKKLVGLTVKKSDDISEWYTQVVQKSELIDYSSVSGCYVYRPWSYGVWERIQEFFDGLIKKHGVKNVYFPLLIPEALLKKETKHVEGFAPEVAWVTEAGHSKLSERLAIRPTSETIMYESFAKWIKSWRDLPLKINQWCSVVRWEFNNPVPFLRSREFLWSEGHSAFASKDEVDKDTRYILSLYKQVFEELLAIPVIDGLKTDHEKFAGALYTTSLETFLPSGKGIQATTSHCLGQNFSQVFDIKFLDEKGDNHAVWQNSWGISTRSIGVMILVHGDDKGLVVPPAVAPVQVVVVPILFEQTKDAVLAVAKNIASSLHHARVHLDDRDNYSPGWKFNEWELKGVPLRVEFGPKDMASKSAVIVRRDTGKKESVSLDALPARVSVLLMEIQQDLLAKARKNLEENKVVVKIWEDFTRAVKERKLILAPFCDKAVCEEEIKAKTEGVKTLNKPFDQPFVKGSCVHCDAPATCYALFAKTY